MPISLNVKQLKKVLLQKSLYDFLKEFWETYEPFELQEHWTLEYLCECFMFSVKHFLPSYIWKDWISDEKYNNLKKETGGHCPVRDTIYGGSYVHNHNWNMPPRHSKSTVLNVVGPAWFCTISPVTIASVCHTSTLATEMNEKRKKLFESAKYRYYFDDDNLQLVRSSASDIQLKSGARLYSTPMASFTGHGADCFVAGTKVNTPQGYKNIEDIVVGDIVLSYNHKTNKIQPSVVQATRKIEKNDLLRIVTTDGRTIESTVDHRFWDVDNGYCRIDEFGKKSKFLVVTEGTFLTQTKIKTKEYIRQNKYVYDIQVADNHNFFVEDILVHNCIIADDLVSSDNAKRDQKIMKNAITFFRSTLPTRLNNKNTGVIWHIQQRLGMGDIAGTILDDKELRKVYSHTELKAISDEDETIIFPCTGKIIEIKKGQPLWEERFGDYTSIKAEVGHSDFETQYNQNPEASLSNIIKEQYITWVEPQEARKFIKESEIQYASHDCPVKDKESNDFHGYCNGYGKASQLLITDAWEQHMALIKEKELMERLQKVSPSIIQIIEDKANGSALLQLLKTEVSGLVAFNPGTDSKTQRLSLASVYMQNGSVMFENTPNVQYLVKQLLKFPYVIHDDIIDAFSQMVLYHFTGATSGVYTNYFTNNNISTAVVPENYLYYSYSATISMDKIKVIAVRCDYAKDMYYVDKEYLFTGITATKDFEEFCITNVKGHNTILDCSFNKVLSSMISNYSIIFDTVDDTDIIKSTQLLKNGFYKKKVFVNQNCSGTINDIAKLRIDDQAVEKGIMDKLDTIDEGYEGCLRQLIQHYKGLNGVWY